jgi:hypothetical protein
MGRPLFNAILEHYNSHIPAHMSIYRKNKRALTEKYVSAETALWKFRSPQDSESTIPSDKSPGIP